MTLEDTILFKNTTLDLSKITIRNFPTNYILEIEGDLSTYVGVVLEGKIHVKAYSLGGSDYIINTIDQGMIYGDVLLYGKDSNYYPGNLVTKGNTTLAIIPNELVREFMNDATFRQNFLQVLSDKVYRLNTKNKLLSQDSIRDKILYYLTVEQKHQQSDIIKLNMTKEELANQLFVQRPSLSRELIRMRNEDLIDFDRWTITIKNIH